MSRHLRPTRVFIVAALLGAVQFIEPLVARAQSAGLDASDPGIRKSVQDLMRTGIEEYRKHNYAGALDAFTKAWTLQPHAEIAANLAYVEMKLEKYRDAAEHWNYYLLHRPPDRDEAESQLSECRKHLGGLHVSVDAKGATVVLDGKPVGPTPLEDDLWLEPGEHTISAQLDKRTSPEKQVSVTLGQTTDVRLEIGVAQPAAEAKPEAAGSSVSMTAPPVHDTGVHHVSNTPKWVAVISGGALTATAVGVGIGFTVKGASAENDIDDLNGVIEGVDPQGYADHTACAEPVQNSRLVTPCALLKDRTHKADSAHTTAAAAYIAGGVLGAATIAVYFLWPEQKHERVALLPWTDARTRGVQLQLKF